MDDSLATWVLAVMVLFVLASFFPGVEPAILAVLVLCLPLATQKPH